VYRAAVTGVKAKRRQECFSLVKVKAMAKEGKEKGRVANAKR